VTAPTDERTLAAIQAIARAAMGEVDYHALYRARVLKQNDDGTCEVRPEDPRIPATSKVPIRYGTPGQNVKLAGGAQCLVGFEIGAPGTPPKMIVVAWESGEVDEATIEASSTIKLKSGAVELALGAGRNVSCVGDFAQISGPILCTVTLGAPGATGPAALGTPTPAVITLLVPVMAPLVSGSPAVKAP
jgi:hypothetical protein